MGCWRRHWQSGWGSANFPSLPLPQVDIWQPWGSWEELLDETWRPGVLRGGGLVLTTALLFLAMPRPQRQQFLKRPCPSPPAPPPSPHLQALLCLSRQILRLPLWGQRL